MSDHENVEQCKERQKLLAGAIVEIAAAAGLDVKHLSLTGPQILLLAEDTIKHLKETRV